MIRHEALEVRIVLVFRAVVSVLLRELGDF
jgi:hypothetical protein